MHLYLKYYLTESNVEAPMQSLPITTNVASSNPTQVIRNYVIKCVCYLRQIGDFPRVLVVSTKASHQIPTITNH